MAIAAPRRPIKRVKQFFELNGPPRDRTFLSELTVWAQQGGGRPQFAIMFDDRFVKA
jgi:hypothetical protein